MATLSVVIPTLNAAERLPMLIKLLKSQTLVPDEIFVVDSSSEDGTAEIARSIPGVIVKIIDRKTFNHGTTRHEALLQTTGDFVSFLTDDAVPANREFLANLVSPLEDKMVAMASGRQLPKSDARRFEQLVRAFNYNDISNVRSKEDVPKFGIKTYFATDVCSVYRRSAYIAVGGFQHVNTNEDMLIAASFINNGYKIAYAADAEVFHSHNLTVKQQYERNKAVGYFLESHAEELGGIKVINEGKKLAVTVSKQLLKELRVGEFLAFCLDCIARFLGNKIGRNEACKLKGKMM